MLNDTLQEVFGVLSIGLMTLVILGYIIWLLRGSDTTVRKILQLKVSSFASWLIVLSAPFIYGFGLIVQDITDHLTDSEYREKFFISNYQHQILRSEGEHRVDTLFQNCKDTTDCKHCVSATGLWKNISPENAYISGLLNRVYSDTFQDVLDFLTSPEEFVCRDREQARYFINTIYYEAKNWTYLQNTYFDELENIQRRIDFSRSTFLVATWGMVGILLSAIWLFARWCLWGRYAITYSNYSARNIFIGLLILIFVGTLGWAGYNRSETNFNERVFGYFFSYLRSEPRSEEEMIDPRMQVNLWMQTSGEYDAITQQTFHTAFEVVLNRVCGGIVVASECTTPVGVDGWRVSEDGRPYAFLMDLDETILDNGSYQSLLILTGQQHSSVLWDAWIQERFDDVRLVPGADEFLDRLNTLRVAPVFISNRPESIRHATIATLKYLGIADKDPMDRLLLKTNSSSKDARRLLIENKYEIIGLIGDNLGDFLDEFNKVPTAVERRNLVRRYRENWGTIWFTLPNPAYGNWQTFVADEPLERNRPQRRGEAEAGIGLYQW